MCPSANDRYDRARPPACARQLWRLDTSERALQTSPSAPPPGFETLEPRGTIRTPVSYPFAADGPAAAPAPTTVTIEPARPQDAPPWTAVALVPPLAATRAATDPPRPRAPPVSIPNELAKYTMLSLRELATDATDTEDVTSDGETTSSPPQRRTEAPAPTASAPLKPIAATAASPSAPTMAYEPSLPPQRSPAFRHRASVATAGHVFSAGVTIAPEPEPPPQPELRHLRQARNARLV